MNSDNEIEIWKTKRLLKTLKDATGAGTSVVTLLMRSGESISKMSQKLTEELGTASNIKSRTNRQSVEAAIKSAQQKLKLYPHIAPANGLAIFSGEVAVANGKTKRVVIDMVPFKPLQTSLYMCDNRFHCEALESLLSNDATFAFIIINGEGFQLATLCGNTRTVIDSETVDLPSKTRRGGQSSARYGRLRDEAKNLWVKTVCERLKRSLVESGLIGKTEGIVLAGSADIKADLQSHADLIPAIRSKIIAVVDVAYGGKQGLHDAITLTKDKLGNVKYVQEREVLGRFFDIIATDGAVSYGLKETMAALEGGVVDTLLIWDKLETERHEIVSEDGNKSVVYLEKSKKMGTSEGINDQRVSQAQQIVVAEPLVDYLVDHRNEYGVQITFVSNATQEGAQFIRGFGGLGAFLRYKFQSEDAEEFDEEWEDDRL